MDLVDFYRTFHPTSTQYTFLAAPGIFSKIDHILGHKASLNENPTYQNLWDTAKAVLR
jgi:hypothetical protein